MSKKYLKATSSTTHEWVDSLKDATKDYRAAVEATQKTLKEHTTLEEVPDPLQGEPRFVICKDDERNAAFAAGMEALKAAQVPPKKEAVRLDSPKPRIGKRSKRRGKRG